MNINFFKVSRWVQGGLLEHFEIVEGNEVRTILYACPLPKIPTWPKTSETWNSYFTEGDTANRLCMCTEVGTVHYLGGHRNVMAPECCIVAFPYRHGQGFVGLFINGRMCVNHTASMK